MVKRHKVLASLTRRRRIEVAQHLEISSLTGKTKAQIVEAIATARTAKTEKLLKLFRLEELKATCRAAGIDDGGRNKAELIARLLNPEAENRTMAKKAKSEKRKIE